MNLWKTTLLAMLAALLAARGASAQNDPYPVTPYPPRIPRTHSPPAEPQASHAAFESALPRAAPNAAWISQSNFQDLVEPPSFSEDLGADPPLLAESEGLRGTNISDADLTDRFSIGSRPFDVGVDLYSPPEFEGGLIIIGRDVAMKIGGFVKADFIYDFNPIDATDSFVTTDIPVGAPPRTNARYHARQSRLSFDTRWVASERTIRIYVEGDFFSDGDHFRLRQAYGELGSLLVGRTWTTFTDVAAAPATLDFEGSVSAVNRRQAQARWTQPLFPFNDDLTLAAAVEDTRFIIELPPGISAEPRSPSPDFVANLRLQQEWGRLQVAGLYRIAGVQPTGGEVITAPAWGLNFTGVILLTDRSKAYYQIVFGKGIGSYRGLPDAAPSAVDKGELLPLFGWMMGVTHNWTDRLSSNITYAENQLDNTPLQPANDVHRTTYLAANLIWNPYERVRVGIEYLYGLRENVDRAVGSANRVQLAFIFDLP